MSSSLALALAFAAATTTSVERLGPFALGSAEREAVRIEATYRESASARALETFRVLDGAGKTLLEESYPVDTSDDGELAVERGLSAGRIVGGPRPLLLIQVGEVPSAPSSGESWLVYEFLGAGGLRQLARFDQQGRGLLNAADSRGDVRLAEGRYLDVDVFLNYFSLVFRFALDEVHHRFVASARCAVPVDPYRELDYASGTVLVREHPELDAPSVPIAGPNPNALELLEACVAEPPSPERVPNSADPDLWIRIRIGSIAGWVRAEDLEKLGVAFAG
jgi:hypothetical protein